MCSFTLDSSPLLAISDALCLSAPPIYCLFRSSYEYSYGASAKCLLAAIAVPSQVLAARSSYPGLILGQVGLPGLHLACVGPGEADV